MQQRVISKYRYESPFPGSKKNEEVLQNTRSCYFKDKSKIEMVVPAKVTKSYMSSNKYYFDTEKWKNIHTKTDKKKEKRPQSALPSNKNYLSWVVDLENIQKVLSFQNDEDIQGIISKEHEAKQERALKLKQEYQAAFQFNTLSPRKFLEQMIERKYKPHFHKYYGQIPE
jgi:hypothetical protein